MRAARASGRCASSRSHMYCAVLVSWYSSTRMYLKLAVIFLAARRGCARKMRIGWQQQVAEIAGVQRLQALLIGRVEFAALAVGEGAGVALGDVGGAEALVLPAVDHLGELLGRPALVVEPLGLDQLLDQPHDVVGVEDGEVGFQAGELGVAAQQLDADRVEGAEPGHALDRLRRRAGRCAASSRAPPCW